MSSLEPMQPDLPRATSPASSRVEEPVAQGSPPATRTQRSAAAITAWLLPFALVVYLALRGGGYDTAVRDEVGAALWLALLAGAALGLVGATRMTRAAWIALGLLAAFAAWTALSATWSESVERSLDSFVLVASYLAAFALALLTQGRQAVERMLSAVAAAIVVVAGLALASRLHPQWFPSNTAAEFLPHVKSRLNYPLNSWNGLAGLLAMGTPLLLAAAIDARNRIVRIAASAAVPVVALTIFFTLSRGGAIATTVGVAAFVALRSRRMQALPVLVLVGGASALSIGIAAQFGALKDAVDTSLAHREGAEMAAILVAICAAVAFVRARLDRAAWAGALARFELPARSAKPVLAATVTLVVVGALVAGATGWLSNVAEDFEQAPGPSSSAARLASASGNGRYQYWQSAIDAMQTAPAEGIGAGTFQYWWAQHGTIYGFTAYAHSLYLETLGETGIIGFILICGAVGWIVAIAIRRALGALSRRRRGWFAAAAGSAGAFAVAMGLDWGWHLPVIPVAFFLIAAAVLQADETDPPARGEGTPPRPRPDRARPVARIAIAAVALPILALTAASAIGAHLIDSSQSDARAHDLHSAYDAAKDAGKFMPWAATPHEQQALVLEQWGGFGFANVEVHKAIEKEPTNWEPYYVLSRIYREIGNLPDARTEYAQARSLNPHSPIFAAHPNRTLPLSLGD